jgi:hypothetical protein
MRFCDARSPLLLSIRTRGEFALRDIEGKFLLYGDMYEYVVSVHVTNKRGFRSPQRLRSDKELGRINKRIENNKIVMVEFADFKRASRMG